jgi:hypothetical protein
MPQTLFAMVSDYHHSVAFEKVTPNSLISALTLPAVAQ